MSLRLRLTLLYSSLLGGVLLLFGVIVYTLVSILLISQVDTLLQQAVNEITDTIRVEPNGDLNLVTFQSLEITENIFVQVWGRDGALRASNVARLTTPLDSSQMRTPRPIYHNTYLGTAHLRVLSVPLEAGSRSIGLLQVAASLGLIDATQQAMLFVLISTSVLSILLSAVGAWLATGQALAPLETVTQTATRITNADDLSRRIPYSGPATSEIGQLIYAFNQTLSRLEVLFNSQRRFLADVSHELRTPLTVIKGNIGLLRRMGVEDEESLSSVEAEVDRLTRMVGDLLLLAQAESGKLPMVSQPVELDTVLLEVFQQMRVLAGERNPLRISEIDQVLVTGDRDRLKQVLVNLVGNAVKYTPPGGQINLGLSKAGDQARLIVQDTGPGIPAQDIPHIFERFYRAEKSRTRGREGSGFGLGLSIAYWIVRNHNGRIEVNSKEGHGTTFCVWLPLAPEAKS